jgi:GGDEF domain-containing protein
MTAEGPLTHLLDRAGALMGRPSAPQAPPEGGGQQMHALLELVPVGIWQLGPDGRTVFANRRLAAFLGGVTPASYGDAGLEPAGPALATHCAGQEWEATLHRPGRVPLRLLVAAAALADGGRLLAIQDVSPLKAAQERIEHLTGHDALTGLANRAALRLGLDAMARDPKGGSLLLINLDDLKAANQRHGLAAGDALLRCAAQRLREAVRPSDLVARLGGDEFAVLAFGAQAADAPCPAASAWLARPITGWMPKGFCGPPISRSRRRRRRAATRPSCSSQRCATRPRPRWPCARPSSKRSPPTSWSCTCSPSGTAPRAGSSAWRR